MTLPRRKQKLPVARLPDRQIAYVADNQRDAEALGFSVDSPIIVRRQPHRSTPTPLSAGVDDDTSQTSGRFRRPDASDVQPSNL